MKLTKSWGRLKYVENFVIMDLKVLKTSISEDKLVLMGVGTQSDIQTDRGSWRRPVYMENFTIMSVKV